MRFVPTGERVWEADAFTIMCANYWTPLAEAMGEAVSEAEGGGEAEDLFASVRISQHFIADFPLIFRRFLTRNMCAKWAG